MANNKNKRTFMDIALSSLIIQSLRVALVLAIFVVLIFFLIVPVLLPQRTFFSTQITTDTFMLPQGQIPFMDINVKEMAFSLTKLETIYVETDSIEINGERYKRADDNGRILIEFNAPRGVGGIKITSHKDDSKINICANAKDANLDSIRTYVIQPEYNMAQTKANHKKTNKNEMTVYTDTSFTVSCDQMISIELTNCNVMISNLNGNNNPGIEKRKTTDRWTNYAFPDENVSIAFPDGFTDMAFNTVTGRSMTLSDPVVNSIEIRNIKEFQLRGGIGDVSVYYNPESMKYDINGQEIELNSLERSISATISSAHKDKYQILISGYANDIKLSSNSLIPSLTNYLKENVYISPTAIVTIIGGAITLIKIHKEHDQKKNDNKNLESEEKQAIATSEEPNKVKQNNNPTVSSHLSQPKSRRKKRSKNI